jgi:hypothetical protein
MSPAEQASEFYDEFGGIDEVGLWNATTAAQPSNALDQSLPHPRGTSRGRNLRTILEQSKSLIPIVFLMRKKQIVTWSGSLQC